MTTALEGGKCSAARPGHSLPPGKTRYPLYRRLIGRQCRSGQVRKISPPPGFDPRTVQPIVSRYTDWVTWVCGSTRRKYSYRYLIYTFFLIFLHISCFHTGMTKSCTETNITPWGVPWFYVLFCFAVRTVHFVQFVVQVNKNRTYIFSNILYIVNTTTCYIVSVSSSRTVLTLCFAYSKHQQRTVHIPYTDNKQQTTNNNFQALLTFYRLYLIIQLRSGEEFNLTAFIEK
jgi:hypothetical protein